MEKRKVVLHISENWCTSLTNTNSQHVEIVTLSHLWKNSCIHLLLDMTSMFLDLWINLHIFLSKLQPFKITNILTHFHCSPPNHISILQMCFLNFYTLLCTFEVHMCTFVEATRYCIHTHTKLHFLIGSMSVTWNVIFIFVLKSVEEFMMIESQPTNVEIGSRMVLEDVEFSHTSTTHLATMEANINFMWQIS